MRKPNYLVSILVFLLVGCTSSGTAPKGDTDSLEQVQKLSAGTVGKDKSVSLVRQAALQETALSLSAQAGLAERAKEINTMLEANAPNLDRIFNFNQML